MVHRPSIPREAVDSKVCCAMALPTTSATCHNVPVQKCMVCRNTFGSAVAAPTDKRGFVTPESSVLGGMGLPARMAARLNPCYEHPVHLLRVVAQTVVSLSRSGAKTMKATTTGTTPALPETDPRLFFSAINGLAHALRILTDGDLDRVQLHRAIGKAARATTSIKRLAEAQHEGGAA